MGCVLEHWVFFDEQKENGNLVRYAKNLLNTKIYRFEPVVTKFAATDAGRFRTGIHERYNALECFKTNDLGILSVYGPCFLDGIFWLGWKSRNGESFFHSLESQSPLDLESILTGLYPLIQAYHNFNRAGLIVGRPDWGRLYRNSHGIYMVDPYYMPYLTEPPCKLPLGLENCRPPETYNGSKLSKYGDLFYLGLIIYLAITSKLPFEVIDGWPTRALFKGDIISPVIFQANLNPFLAEQIKVLLHPNPEKRGTIQQLEAFWHHMLEQKSFLAPAQAQALNVKEQQKFRRKIRWQKIRLPIWGTIAGLIFLAIFVFLTGARKNGYHAQEIDPIIAVQDLYQTAAGPPRGACFQAPFIMDDFERERKKRLNTAAELLMRPLAEIKQTRILRRTRHQAVIEVLVCRWEWMDEKWQNHLYKERLTVENKGEKWLVTARKTPRKTIPK